MKRKKIQTRKKLEKDKEMKKQGLEKETMKQ
jgi:hypothetical protein